MDGISQLSSKPIGPYNMCNASTLNKEQMENRVSLFKRLKHGQSFQNV